MPVNFVKRVAKWWVQHTYPKYVWDSVRSHATPVRPTPTDPRSKSSFELEFDAPAEVPSEKSLPDKWKDYWNTRVRTEHRPSGQKFFWRSKTDADHEALSDLVVRYTDLKQGDKVFEFGCGCGQMLDHLHQRRAIEGVGIDYSEEAIDWAKERYGDKFEFHCCSVDDVSFAADAEYGAVVCIGVAFYLSQDMFTSMLREMLRITRPDGRIYIHLISGREQENYLVVSPTFWLGNGNDFGTISDMTLVKSSIIGGSARWRREDGSQIDITLSNVVRNYPSYSVLITKSCNTPSPVNQKALHHD